MVVEVLVLLVFLAAVVLCLLSGYPLAFGLGGSGVVVLGILILLSALGVPLEGSAGWPILEATAWRDLSPIANEVYGFMTPSVQTLIAIPLFILMGALFQRSQIAAQLLDGLGTMLQGLRGGQGLAVVLVGALLAASTGVVGASVATLTVLAYPSLRQGGYGPGPAAGLVASAGTLGQIIPPSIILLLLADQVGSQFQVAQLALGDFAPRAVTSGDLFRAALVPAAIVVLGFAACAVFLASARRTPPSTTPSTRQGEAASGDGSTAQKPDQPDRPSLSLLLSLLPPLSLIALVLGSILLGLADTSAAATFGAAGAVVLAARSRWLSRTALGLVVLLLLWRLWDVKAIPSQPDHPFDPSLLLLLPNLFYPVVGGLLFVGLCGTLALAVYRTWRQQTLPGALDATLRMTALIFAILLGAALFSLCFKAIGGDDLLKAGISAALTANLWLHALVGGATADAAQARAALLLLLVLIFLLGFVLEFVEIIVVVLPLLLPLVFAVPPEHLDPVWAAILIALALQISFLTPPFGFALFYFRGAAGSEVRSLDLYRGVWPFIAVQVTVLALVWLFPRLVAGG